MKASRLGFKSGHCYCCPTLACSLLYCGDGWILNTFKLLNGSPPHISGSFTCTRYFLLHNAHKLCSLELYSKCYSYGKLRYAPNNCHMWYNLTEQKSPIISTLPQKLLRIAYTRICIYNMITTISGSVTSYDEWQGTVKLDGSDYDPSHVMAAIDKPNVTIDGKTCVWECRMVPAYYQLLHHCHWCC